MRAALAWTGRHADAETDLAYALVVGLPAVWQALLSGELDRGKAMVFADHLVDLTPEQISAICTVVLPVAVRLTPWQIAERIKRLIRDLDPGYFARRYRKAVRDRKVIGYLDEHGAAVITASGLPAADSAAALERVDALARAARRAGHPGTLDQLRADVFLGLLDGSLHSRPGKRSSPPSWPRPPARRADQDLTRDHALGGPTTSHDLGPACRHDHMLKTDGHWNLDQPEPGTFVWTSPLGRTYPVTPETILPPAPEALVREPDPDHDRPADPTERLLALRPRRRAPPLPPRPTTPRVRHEWNADPAQGQTPF